MTWSFRVERDLRSRLCQCAKLRRRRAFCLRRAEIFSSSPPTDVRATGGTVYNHFRGEECGEGEKEEAGRPPESHPPVNLIPDGSPLNKGKWRAARPLRVRVARSA